MKIRITNGSGWYERKVGEVFEVLRTQIVRGNKEYIVWERGPDYNWVNEDDCEIVES